MITIRIDKDPQGICALNCAGHAGFDDGEGLDLVCAAVSALTGALGLGLAEKSHLAVTVGDGHFSVDLRGQDASSESRFLLDTVASSLVLLAQNYPGFMEVTSGQEGQC